MSTRSTCPTERRCLRVPPTCIPATIVFSADRSERSHPFAKCILFTFFISRRRFASGPSTQSTWTPHSRFSVVSRISPTPVVPFSSASPSLPIKSSSRGRLLLNRCIAPHSMSSRIMVKYALIVASLLDLICTRVCRLSRRYSFDERGYVVLGPSPHVRLLAACRRHLLLDVCACDGSHIVSLYPFFCALSARV